jgi:AraC-like DNA-binding protein
MSNTIVDMPKVTQMLDAGWVVRIYMGENKEFLATTEQTAAEAVEDCDYHDGEVMTDDFTPEQALTRMAYKVHGQII